MRIVLVPLDERPANVRDPALTAAIAGAELVTPPPELLGVFRTPGDTTGLAAWLRAEARLADGLVVALDQLCHGGLLASRLTDEAPWVAAGRLAVLEEVRADRPSLPVMAVSAVTRAPDADVATEEPAYWARHGRDLHRLLELLHRLHDGEPVADQLAAHRATIPPAVIADVLRRRSRNHQVTLAAQWLVARGVLDLLVCCSDDTASHGLGTAEQRWLGSWTSWQDLGDRVLHYPGADEVGTVLVARLLARAAGVAPRVAMRCAVAGGLDRVAAYEDGPVGRTAARQVEAAGGTVVPAQDRHDLVLAIHPPAVPAGDWVTGPSPEDLPADTDAVAGLSRILDDAAVTRTPVAVADVAHGNGADPAVVALLAARGPAAAPLAYAAWNTAGNAIGGVLGPAITALAAGAGADPTALRRLLVHRLVEDAGYMTAVRPRARTVPRAAETEEGLVAWLAALGPLDAGWCVDPGSVRHPWDRTFEVDFSLLPPPEGDR